MSIFGNILNQTGKQIHDGAIKVIAEAAPNVVGEAQIAEWNDKARDASRLYAKAAVELAEQKARVEQVTANIARYSDAANKLAESNPSAAEKAADQAIALTATLEEENATLVDRQSWADETKVAATAAEQKVSVARKAIENAKRDQERAQHEKTIAQTRLADRERLAGITNDLNGSDAAINALTANAKAARQEATASKFRADVLTSTNHTDDDVINEALKAVEPVKTETLAEKLAKLNK